eukprot:UN27336
MPRYFVLRSQFLYQFRKHSDDFPSETIFLHGSIVEPITDAKMHGFRITFPCNKIKRKWSYKWNESCYVTKPYVL